MKQRFWEQIWVSFLATNGHIFSIVSVALAFASPFVVPTLTVPTVMVVFIGSLLLFITIVFSHAVYAVIGQAAQAEQAVQAAQAANRNILPGILYVRSPAPAGEGLLLCLLEPSDLFSYDSLVSFYYLDGDFSQYIGWGSVLNIQDDKKIQVVMDYYTFGDNDLFVQLSQGNVQIIAKTQIKPSVPRDIISYNNF